MLPIYKKCMAETFFYIFTEVAKASDHRQHLRFANVYIDDGEAMICCLLRDNVAGEHSTGRVGNDWVYSVEDVCVILVGLLTSCVSLLLIKCIVILLSLSSKLSKSPTTHWAFFLRSFKNVLNVVKR